MCSQPLLHQRCTALCSRQLLVQVFEFTHHRHAFRPVDQELEEISSEDEGDSITLIKSAQPSLQRSVMSKCSYATSRIGDDWGEATVINSTCINFVRTVALTILGTLTALIAFVLDLTITKLHHVRSLLIAPVFGFSQYLTWVAFGVTVAMLAVVLTLKVAPSAEGSGIPQLKTILKGQELPHYLSSRTLGTKIVGTVLAEGSGLPIGRVSTTARILMFVCRQGRAFCSHG